MKRIQNVLLKYQNKKYSLKTNEEYSFYEENRHILKKSEYRYFYEINNSFQLISANIIISSLLNKQNLDSICKDLFSSIYLKSKFTNEDFLKYYHARIVDIKYLNNGGQKVLIPLFNTNINHIYYDDPFKLLEPPHDQLFTNPGPLYINPFEVYNFSLFDSFFTKLVKIKDCETFQVFYHFDFETIYFINNQGICDCFLPLFDKWMEKINTSHVSTKLDQIISCYQNCDKQGIVQALLDNNLISTKMYDLLLRKIF